MGVSVRLSRNTRVYLPFWIAIPLWLIVAAVWAVILAAMLLGWLLVILPGKAVTAWRDSPRRSARQAQRPEVVAAKQARQEEDRQQEEARQAEHRRQQEDQVEEDLRQARARLEEDRRQQEDHDSRTRRGVIAECRIDPLNGGSFTVKVQDTEMVFNVDPNAAIHFLPLKKGDIVQVTLAPSSTGLEEFWQLSRASGAKPRSAIKLTGADMEWLGLYTRRADGGGQEAGS